MLRYFSTFLLFFSYFFTVNGLEIHNVCKSFVGYTTRLDCSHNPDVDSYTDKIIRGHDYPSETHQVTTNDGYILTVFRIPNNSNSSQTIYIQHGANTESTVWVDIAERSLAFYLYDLGYDVWMGNVRGSFYSRGHTNKNIGPIEYWDFSLDELALYDIPAQLNLVSETIKHKTNKKIIYIGHSMGTTLSYMYSIIRKEEAENTVCGFINLAPVTYFDHSIIGSLLLKPLIDMIQFVCGVLIFPITPNRNLNQIVLKELCFLNGATARACNEILNVAYGRNTPQRLPEDEPLIMSYIASGISSKIISQFAQFRQQKFNHFDYRERNLEVYGSLHPPDYNIKDINNRFLLLYGPADTLSHIGDINNFRKRLSDPGLFEVEKVENFNHIDFMYAKDIIPLLYEKMMPFINRAEGNFCH